MDLPSAQAYLAARVDEFKRCCHAGSPCVFLGAAAFLEYLSKAVVGQDDRGDGYKTFVKDWLSKVRADYRDFAYKDGTKDLPKQMYHVLRCGIVHSFSLIPDNRDRKAGGRDRSIVLCHRAEAVSRGLHHLSPYSTTEISDAALFVAEDFVDDLAALVNIVFAAAAGDSSLEKHILKWLSDFPPISGGY